MELLYFLEKIRLPGLNELMLGITAFGGEIAFLMIALAFFWCVDKNRGYYILAVGFFGTLANQFMKLFFRVPRPWVLDENFTILEQARAGATGYSFPSGHTQNAVGTFGAIAYTEKQRWLRNLCIALAVLVPFSRMYLGVHTPWDVLTAAGMALLLILALKPVAKGGGKWFPWMLGGMLVCAAGFLCYVELYPFPAEIDKENLNSGIKNAYTLLGALLGLIAAYPVEKKWVRFSEKAIWWAQVLKVILGLLVVLAVKEGLKIPLDLLFSGHMAAVGVRYFLVVITAGVVWPLSFTWFGKLGKKGN